MYLVINYPSILSIISAIGSFNSEGLSRLGVLLPFFFIPSLLVYVWGFYFIVTITKYLYKKKMQEKIRKQLTCEDP